VAHVVDGVADDERDEDLDGVVEENGDAAPGEGLPVALEVRDEGPEAVCLVQGATYFGGVGVD